MQIIIPTLSYELNTMIRKHREEIGYTQEEFAFLIGKELVEIQQNEDLTSDAAYNINHANFYARVLGKKLTDLFFENSLKEANLKISAKKKAHKNGLIHYTAAVTENLNSNNFESYSIHHEPHYEISDADFNFIFNLIYEWLKDGYFRNGVTGYKIYQDLLALNNTGKIKLPEAFRPILLSRSLVKLSNKRKNPKLMPRRFLPKTPEKWLLYKEDLE